MSDPEPRDPPPLPPSPIDFTRGPIVGDLDVSWIHGCPPRTPCDDPPIQVHRFDEHTLVLRQSKAATYEAPFLYLLFGNDRALLFDTGAVADLATMPTRTTVDELIADWLTRHPRPSYALTVAHTHAHGDHVAGDGQFADRPDTIVVAHDPAAVQTFFGFTDWPGETTQYDLGGGRVLDITGIPGHHAASIAVYDPWTGWLLTGDTVYPGRLYVKDASAFRDSLDRLVTITTTRDVRAVMGCHVEMTRQPRVDYPIGTRYQPDEPPLPMTVAQLRSVHAAAHEIADRRGVHMYDDFAIWIGPCVTGVVRQLARRTATAIKQRLSARLR